jgi:Zn-finger nucleic acid-binding protein
METHPYYGPGNVIIDSCAACDLVWLDFGELTQIVDAPGRDRGSRELVPAWAMDRRGADLDRDDDDDVDPLELLTRLF